MRMISLLVTTFLTSFDCEILFKIVHGNFKSLNNNDEKNNYIDDILV